MQAAQGPAMPKSFLQVSNMDDPFNQPQASPSPDVRESARMLQAGDSSAPPRMQSARPSSHAPDIVRGDPNVASASVQPGWLSRGAMARRLLETGASLAGDLGGLGGRRALQASPEVPEDGAGGVLGMLQAMLPSEAHPGSEEAEQALLQPSLVRVPSENMLYKDYIPGLVGDGGSPGFMSLAERLYKIHRRPEARRGRGVRRRRPGGGRARRPWHLRARTSRRRSRSWCTCSMCSTRSRAFQVTLPGRYAPAQCPAQTLPSSQLLQTKFGDRQV